MAGIAVQCGVRSDQRESVQVRVDLLELNIPPLHVVALLAVGPHLAFVDVRMAVRAQLSDVSKHRLDVALGAAHTLVHAAQGILRGVVIKLGHGTDGLPSAQRVAVLTGNAQASVRAARVRGRLCLPARRFPANENCDRDYGGN